MLASQVRIWVSHLLYGSGEESLNKARTFLIGHALKSQHLSILVIFLQDAKRAWLSCAQACSDQALRYPIVSMSSEPAGLAIHVNDAARRK